MYRFSSLVLLICSIALSHTSVQAQAAYTFWHLAITKSGATLTSHFDYEAPAGMLEAFTCTRGSPRVAIAQFVHGAEVPEMKTVVRNARFRSGCDALCKATNAEIYEGEQLLLVQRLRPTGAYNSEVPWSKARQMLLRRLKDVEQFGDVPESGVKEGIKDNLRDLERFRTQCNLPVG